MEAGSGAYGCLVAVQSLAPLGQAAVEASRTGQICETRVSRELKLAFGAPVLDSTVHGARLHNWSAGGSPRAGWPEASNSTTR